ncbi:MAG: hypothetical protein BBJ57_05990 [Desulfobacterales bacterium PC51MH44]|nr:MAG: hypothetical protein BBJ57_05990 [Desulfobacterales bacterium PC51MH44]
MPSLLIKLLLFISSYFPLALIFAIQFFLKSDYVCALTSIIIGGLGLIGMIIYLLAKNRINQITVTVVTIGRRDNDAMSYIVSYILPFIVLPTGDFGDKISLGIFLFVLCILYINSGMIHINPTLNLFGWHIYEITRTDGEVCSLLTRRKIKNNSEIEVVEMDDTIYIGVNK